MTWRKILGGELGPLIVAGVAIVAMAVIAALVCLVKISLLSPAAAAPGVGGDTVETTRCGTADALAALLAEGSFEPVWYGMTGDSVMILYLSESGRWVIVESYGARLVCERRRGIGYGGAEKSQ